MEATTQPQQPRIHSPSCSLLTLLLPPFFPLLILLLIICRAQFQAVMPDELSSDIVYMMATSSVLEGEMIESSSPADIIFWLVRETICVIEKFTLHTTSYSHMSDNDVTVTPIVVVATEAVLWSVTFYLMGVFHCYFFFIF